MGLFGRDGGHLHFGQENYDRNGDGKLNGREWTDWYFGTYGTDIELAERQRNNARLSEQVGLAQLCFDSAEYEFQTFIVNQAECLFGKPLPGSVMTLLTRVYFYHAMKGVLDSGEWSRSHVIPSGQAAPGMSFNLGKPLLRLLPRAHPGIADFESISSAMERGVPLFGETAELTAAGCGSFWQKCIEAAGKGLADNDCFADEDIECIEAEQMLDSFLHVECCFRLQEDADHEAPAQALCGIFRSHLKKYTVRQKPRFCAPRPPSEADDALESDDVQRIAKRLPLTMPEAKCGSFTDILRLRYEYEPETAIAMLRCLLDAADLGDYTASLRLICGAMDAWEEYDLSPLLEALERDSGFCRQLFLSAYLGAPHERIFRESIRSGRSELTARLTELLESRVKTADAAKNILQNMGADEPDAVYTYCSLQFPGIERSYSYLAGGKEYAVGDEVLAPFGKDNAPRVGKIISVRRCTALDAPYPPKKTKTLLGKAEDIPPPMVYE